MRQATVSELDSQRPPSHKYPLMRPARSGTILNINDNEASRYSISRTLSSAGFEVLEAETAKKGMQLATDKQPGVIILDIRLPDLDGFEACAILKRNQPTSSIPILHLTAHAISTESRIKSLECGAESYLSFPVEPNYLVAAIQALLRMKNAEEARTQLLDKEKLERKRLQKALDKLEAERSVREQFVATLTHDLRSPLTAIKMTAQLLMRRSPDPETLVSQCTKIIASTNRADKMIRDLLDVSLLRVGQKLPVEKVTCNLAQAIREITEDFISVHGDRITAQVQEIPVAASVDCGSLRRALDNLVQNAIKYGQQDGEITISMRMKAESVEIAVHNLGNPIPEAARKNLFDSFMRAPDVKGSGKPGWGLGLALVRGVAEAHGGTVEVESTAGFGTRFILRLPVLLRPASHLVPEASAG
jgi:signal transduction histidine kinase